MPATVPDDSRTPNSSASACAVRSFDTNCPLYRQMMIPATRVPYCTDASAPAGSAALVRVPAALLLDQPMLGHCDRDFRQVEDLAALHPGDRSSHQPRPAPGAAGRLMPKLLVRPGYLRQRRARMPILPSGSAAALLRGDRGFGGHLSSPHTGRRL
jgi:hypothetical protein